MIFFPLIFYFTHGDTRTRISFPIPRLCQISSIISCTPYIYLHTSVSFFCIGALHLLSACFADDSNPNTYRLQIELQPPSASLENGEFPVFFLPFLLTIIESDDSPSPLVSNSALPTPQEAELSSAEFVMKIAYKNDY